MELYRQQLIIAAILLLTTVVIGDSVPQAGAESTARLPFPWTISRDTNLADNNIAHGMSPFEHSTIIVNGNVALALNSNGEKCCGRPRPAIPWGYSIISEDEEYITAIKFHPDRKVWNEARKICYGEGGFLAYPTSKAEEDLYLRMINDNKVNELWIGVHDYYKNGDYATVLGEIAVEVGYYTWLPGEPNDVGGSEPCLHYWRPGGVLGLNDHLCTQEYPFNCKIKLPKN